MFTIIFGLFFFTFNEITNCMMYEPNLKVGQISVHLPKTPPKSPEIKSIYNDAEVFAHHYDKKIHEIQKNQNKFRPVRASIKLENDFNRDLNNLKSHLRQVNYNNFDQNNPSISDATLFQLVTEFVRKLSMISMQTHCFIYGCNNIPNTSIDSTLTTPSSSESETSETTEENSPESQPEEY